jgi:hypothetical protein
MGMAILPMISRQVFTNFHASVGAGQTSAVWTRPFSSRPATTATSAKGSRAKMIVEKGTDGRDISFGIALIRLNVVDAG